MALNKTQAVTERQFWHARAAPLPPAPASCAAYSICLLLTTLVLGSHCDHGPRVALQVALTRHSAQYCCTVLHSLDELWNTVLQTALHCRQASKCQLSYCRGRLAVLRPWPHITGSGMHCSPQSPSIHAWGAAQGSWHGATPAATAAEAGTFADTTRAAGGARHAWHRVCSTSEWRRPPALATSNHQAAPELGIEATPSARTAAPC